MTAKKKCVTCAPNAPDPQDEIEVDYKDFKTSELLEIRRKRQAATSAAETKTVKEYPGGKVPKSTAPQKTSPCDKENSFPILAVAILILMLIAGAFLLVRNIIPH